MSRRFDSGTVLLIVAAAMIFRPQPSRRVVVLPAGVTYLHAEMVVGGDTELRGAAAGSTLRFAPGFSGRALIAVLGSNVVLRDFRIEGDRDTAPATGGLPPYDVPFVRFTRGNGVLADGAEHLRITGLRFTRIAGFAVLVSRAREVAIDSVEVSDSGSRNAAGRNNSTGGILLEEGTSHFRVTACTLTAIRGNGIWTHSLYTSPRNTGGVIAGNRFDGIGRDAIQVGHAVDVRVAENTGRNIGYPVADVDAEGRAIPVAIDTAGNVERSVYAANVFTEIDGKCIDLDGFHDGEVRENVCVNRGAPTRYPFGNYGIVMNNTNPDMQSRNIHIVGNTIDGPLYGGIFVIGTGNRVERNRLLNLNTAHCGCVYLAGEPYILSSGIYLGSGAERPAPAQGNIVENNEIQGFQMTTHCLGNAPQIAPDWNRIGRNRCRN